ncbi:TPA: restriction endonuclease subunit S [Staphylococcus aureus]|nr:restriction endonuclease subunit S [Staphylococcus aureus]HDH4248052.1 restriction endonuclease subunit S [Staphylococcus aureus]HDH4408493.1 restriction endonuclease subunit S [Staphylococcus aureus]HDH4518293.1 restriction endonuclease subunit S [Staphylococcus aureus]HDH4528952.1 restriction endonuclease subunit S [Staphylococcus aureus]
MSNIQKKNVPELRFPEFEGEWEEEKLGEVGTFTSGGTPLKSKSEYWNGDIPWITTGDIHTIKRENITNFITEKGLNESSAKLITNEAILIAMYGQGKTRGMSAILNFEATTNQACAIYQTNQNINFVFQYFQKLYEFLRSLSNEGSQKNLSLSLLKEITLNYPNEQEQKKIGDFFSKLDRQIELEEQKLELLQQQKKGYMQKIFSQELRFKDENGKDYPEWVEKKLEDIIKVNSGKDYKHLDNGDIPVYGTGGYMTSVSEPLSEIDAVGIGRKGTINKPYLLEAPFWTVDTLFYCTPKKEADILFILSLFREINWKVYDESTGVPSLSKQTIIKINRFVPTNKEQQKIGQFFKKIDNKIKIQKQVIELLKKRKKTLLQKMFI